MKLEENFGFEGYFSSEQSLAIWELHKCKYFNPTSLVKNNFVPVSLCVTFRDPIYLQEHVKIMMVNTRQKKYACKTSAGLNLSISLYKLISLHVNF